MKSKIKEKIKFVESQTTDRTPKYVLEFIALQLIRQESAKEKVDDEGVVVRDMKGSVIPHPAIKIETEAGKLACELIGKYKKPKR